MPRWIRNSEIGHRYKKINKKTGQFYFAFMTDKGHKDQHLKIQAQYTNTNELITVAVRSVLNH